jgi:hypothetical protein
VEHKLGRLGVIRPRRQLYDPRDGCCHGAPGHRLSAGPPARLTPERRELEIADFNQQHSATWELLNSAQRHRDVLLQFHAAAVATLVALSQVRPVALAIAIYAVAATFGFVAARYSLLELQEVRMLQFWLYSGIRFSRTLLSEGIPTYLSDLIDEKNIRVRRLRCQHDPMGMAVASVRSIMIADGVLAILLGGAAVAVMNRQAQGSAEVTLFALASLVLLSIAFMALTRNVDASIRASEERLGKRVIEKYRDLGQIEPEVAHRLLLQPVDDCRSTDGHS